MRVTHLLDTNILSALYRARPGDPLHARVDEMEGALAIATPVWHELRYGCGLLEEGRRKEALRRFLEEVVRPTCAILPYDPAAADWHAEARIRQHRIGKPAPFVDGQIAAIAFVNDLVLVTDNVSDFEAFPTLRVENWLSV